jgi:hypothetical protein
MDRLIGEVMAHSMSLNPGDRQFGALSGIAQGVVEPARLIPHAKDLRRPVQSAEAAALFFSPSPAWPSVHEDLLFLQNTG